MLQYYNCGGYFIIRFYLILLISSQRLKKFSPNQTRPWTGMAMADGQHGAAGWGSAGWPPTHEWTYWNKDQGRCCPLSTASLLVPPARADCHPRGFLRIIPTPSRPRVWSPSSSSHPSMIHPSWTDSLLFLWCWPVGLDQQVGSSRAALFPFFLLTKNIALIHQRSRAVYQY